MEPELVKLNDEQLRKRSLSLRYRAKSGEPLSKLLVEAYALVREAGRRTINMRHFDVQMLGGIAMFHRSIVEMQTGEGKTLTATLPMYLYALIGKGCHLATVNDYLARRDADWMNPIYHALGMTVGVIETQMSQDDRRKAYPCDVTYGTAKEFGFDFLRDRLLLRRIAEGQTDLLGGMLGHGSAGERKTRARRRLFRPGRRGRQHPDRRSPHAADHQRPAHRRAEAGSRMLQVERGGCRPVRRRGGLRVRPREEDGRTDPRGPAKGRGAGQAAGIGHGGHGRHLSLHRAGDPGRARVQARPAVRRPRRRDRDRRRVHRPFGRRPQVARGHPPGGRGQAGRRGDRGHRPGRPGHHPRLLSPLRKAGRHDRHGDRLRRRVAANLSLPRGAHSHEPAGHPAAAAARRSSAPKKPSGRPSWRRSASCTRRAGRC